MTYTPDSIRASLEPERDRLFAPYAMGRPATWATDLRTKDTWCLGSWLDEEMRRIGTDDLTRRVQLAEFNRYCRSDQDRFELAACIMNATVTGNFNPRRKTHRRWG